MQLEYLYDRVCAMTLAQVLLLPLQLMQLLPFADLLSKLQALRRQAPQALIEQ